MRKYLFLFACLLLLFGCTNQADDAKTDQKDNTAQGDEANDSGDGETGSIVDADDKENSNNLPLTAYFMKDGTEAHFEGEGNEYAAFTSRTKYLDENYVSVYEDNGGTVMLRVYRIEDDQILLVWEEGERYEELKADELALESLEPMKTYLKMPLEKGTEFDGWVITDTQATVETPYKKFDHVVVTELKTDDGTTRRYFAEGFGEVKREFFMENNGPETTVTSTLSKIE